MIIKDDLLDPLFVFVSPYVDYVSNDLFACDLSSGQKKIHNT